MKKALTLLITFLIVQSSIAQMSQWEENFVRQYDPQTYSYYKFGEGISNQGKQIASSLSQQLSRYQSLINTQDPDALLADFQSKMQNIQSLEQSYIQKSNKFAYNAGQQIGNAINNKDAMGAISGLIGFGSQMSAQKEAKRKLAQQKAALKQQRVNKMSQVYWKAKKFNTTKIEEYINRAAYARNLKDEKYNLEFVKNLKCYANSMKNSWSSLHTRWLQNNCAKPLKPTINTIENKFIAKDVQIRKVAERKYKFYEESKYDQFKSAAISYAAAAAKTKASAANYYLLGKYYVQENPVLGLSTLLTVRDINPNYKKEELEDLIASATKSTENDIIDALNKNDVAYLNSFLNSGLDRLIKIDGKSILTEAISIDNPDAVQTILNKYIDGLTQEQVNEKIQKTILLCAFKNSYKTIQRFSDLGVPVDFRINKYHPIDIAIKGNAAKAYKKLLDISEEADSYKEKYKNSTINIFMNIDNNPQQAANDIDEISDSKKIEEITAFLFDKIDDNENMLSVLLSSKNTKSYIKNNPKYYQIIKQRFVDDIKVSSPKSMSASILKSGLVSFNEIPIYGELTRNNKVKNKVKKNKQTKIDVTIELQINTIVKGLREVEGTNAAINYKSLISFWNEYKTRKGALKNYEINAVNTAYNAFANKYGLPKVKTKGTASVITSFKFENLEEKSLALVAFASDNYDLFKELDVQFNLDQVNEKDGKNLIEYMLNDSKKMTSNSAYLSKDFNFKNNARLKNLSLIPI